MPLAKPGEVIVNVFGRRRYEVVGPMVAKGGFGEVYRARSLSERGRPIRCLKLTTDAATWHGEAYFGALFGHDIGVVEQLDAFGIHPVGKRPARLAIVCEWIGDGTLADWIDDQPDYVFGDDEVRRLVGGLLKTLIPMHKAGITHRDITPQNVFISRDRLVLGDFGVMHQRLHGAPIEAAGSANAVFLPSEVQDREWVDPSVDVYLVGLIAFALVTGERWYADEVGWQALKDIDCDDDLKAWIRTATSPRGDRFEDAEEALLTLTSQRPTPARPPRSLRGHGVVFTGKLDGVTRAEATRRARAAGATVQDKVNGSTTVVVRGELGRLAIGQERGTKMFDAERRMRRGAAIAVLTQPQFERLAPGGRARHSRP